MAATFTFVGVVSDWFGLVVRLRMSNLDFPSLEGFTKNLLFSFHYFFSHFTRHTAYAFGATVKAELLDLVQAHGQMTFEESEAYLRELMEEGRFCSDLA